MIMVSIDSKEVRKAVDVGPCFSASEVKTTLTMTKEVYYWVSPEAIENDSEDIIKAMDDKNEAQIVNKMMDLIRGKDQDDEKKREDKEDADEAKRDADEKEKENSNPPPPTEETQNDDRPSQDSE